MVIWRRKTLYSPAGSVKIMHFDPYGHRFTKYRVRQEGKKYHTTQRAAYIWTISSFASVRRCVHLYHFSPLSPCWYAPGSPLHVSLLRLVCSSFCISHRQSTEPLTERRTTPSHTTSDHPHTYRCLYHHNDAEVLCHHILSSDHNHCDIRAMKIICHIYVELKKLLLAIFLTTSWNIWS